MDISYIIVFIITSLLPAGTKECKAFAENADNSIFTLMLNEKNQWEMKTEEDKQPRRFTIKDNQINIHIGESELTYNMGEAFENKQINWKKVKMLTLKGGEMPSLEILRQKNSFTLNPKKGKEVDKNEKKLTIKF